MDTFILPKITQVHFVKFFYDVNCNNLLYFLLLNIYMLIENDDKNI